MIVPLLILLAPPQAAPAPDYVLDSGWEDSGSGEFYESWFGKHLRAMQEPPLSDGRDVQGYKERFRLLVLPNSAPAYAYRIDVRPNGATTLKWTLLSGKGGYAPGHVAREGTMSIRGRKLTRLREAIAAAAFQTLPREEKLKEDEEGNFTICIHGTMVVFEFLNAEGPSIVTRYCGIDGEPLQRLEDIVTALKPRDDMS